MSRGPAQRTSERRLTGLKELGITAIGDRRRLEAEHRAEQQMSIAEGALGGSHQPVRREEFVAAARAALFDLIDECGAVNHRHPILSGERQREEKRKKSEAFHEDTPVGTQRHARERSADQIRKVSRSVCSPMSRSQRSDP